MISEEFCGVDTVEPRVSVVGDCDGTAAAASGFRVVWTPCNYGGRRAWLVCPHCGHRRTKLYGPALHRCSPDIAWCRECLQFGYWSHLRADWVERRRRKAERIRERLGGSTDLYAPFPRRPWGMHRRTYAALRQHGLALQRLIAVVDQARFELECLRGVRLTLQGERRVFRDWIAGARAAADEIAK